MNEKDDRYRGIWYACAAGLLVAGLLGCGKDGPRAPKRVAPGKEVTTQAPTLKAAELPKTGTLVTDGAPQMPILAGSVEKPVAELRHYLKEISGAEFQLTEPKEGATGLHVGLATDFPWLKLENTAQLGAEGFILKSDGQNVFLIGHNPLGVQHAVTTFLHRLGCRWFFPGRTWEVIPKKKTIEGTWDERQSPDFSIQRRIWYGFGAYPKCKRDKTEWDRHNRMGGPQPISIGHTWGGLNPKTEFEKHPEWFALVGEKRQPSKPCYSHPEVIKRATESALAQAAKGKKMITMSPPDGLGYCACERCFAVFQGAKPYQAHRTWFAKRPDGTVVNVTSETLFGMMNQVAAAVAKEYPDVLIGCYAYSAYSHPPSFKLHPNVYLQTTTAYRRTSLTLEEQLEAFGKKVNNLGIREYYSVYQWDWDWPNPGKMTPEKTQESLRFFHRQGVSAINAEASNNWATRGLGYYVASRLLWDVDADTKPIIKDFYEKAFGPAAAPMERYYVRWYGEGVAALDTGVKREPAEPYAGKKRPTLEALKASFRDLDEAAGLVKDKPDYLARVDHIRMYAHYLFLRQRLAEAAKAKDKDAIVEAVKAETIFGGRLHDTNMIHTRPLIGKAFHRRFRPHMKLLEGIPEAASWGKGWRSLGKPPSPEELETLWAEDKAALGIE